MRAVVTVLSATVLALAGVACDSQEVEDRLDQAADTVSDAATEVGDAIGDAASEVEDTASEVTQLAGFCDAARRVREAVEANNAGDALAAAEDLVAEAPEDVQPEAETVRDAVQAWHDGDEQAIEDEEFRTAADDLRTYAEERCDPTN